MILDKRKIEDSSGEVVVNYHCIVSAAVKIKCLFNNSILINGIFLDVRACSDPERGGSAFRKNFHFELDFSVIDRCSAEHHVTSVLRNAGGGIAADIGILADIFSLSDEL